MYKILYAIDISYHISTHVHRAASFTFTFDTGATVVSVLVSLTPGSALSGPSAREDMSRSAELEDSTSLLILMLFV